MKKLQRAIRFTSIRPFLPLLMSFAGSLKRDVIKGDGCGSQPVRFAGDTNTDYDPRPFAANQKKIKKIE